MTKTYDAAFRDALELAAEKRQAIIGVSPDNHVESVRNRLLERSIVGLEKYGVTTERDDVPIVGWMRHAQEEALDMAVYLEVLINKFKGVSNG